MTTKTALVQSRVHSALLLALTSDALSMPAHWFYTPSDIPAFFPPSGITKMEAAPATHPHDFMKLPEKEAEEGKRIIGDVILKGKRQAWGVTNGHIHAGLPAGANTLNADVLRLTTRWLAGRKGEYSKDGFLAEYVKFLTSSEPLYADPYAESYHRAFFTSLQEGKKLDECGSPSHYIGGFAVTIAVITPVLVKTGDVARAQAVAAEHLELTHQGEELSAALTEYVALVARLLLRGEGESAAEIINEFAAIRLDAKVPNWRSLALDRTPGLSVDAEVVGKAFGLSCMINDAWSSVLYLAAKYHNDVATGLLANVNLGGENVHRGLVLGVLLGLANGRVEEPFSKQLQHADTINAEIGAYVRAVVDFE